MEKVTSIQIARHFGIEDSLEDAITTDASAGLDTWQEWKMAESPRRYCLVAYPSLVPHMAQR